MALTEGNVEAYECPSCGRLVCHEGKPCCDKSRETVTATITYDQPEVESVIKAVFNISSTDLAICRVLLSNSEMTVRELAAELSLDRSTINRRLNHLVELDIVEQQPQILTQGGEVYVYAPADGVYRRLRLGLYQWLADAEEGLAEVRQERVERLVEEAKGEAADVPDSRTDADGSATFRIESTNVGATNELDSHADRDENDSQDEEAEVEMTNETDSRADGDESDSLVEEAEGGATDGPDARTDEDESSSLIGRLFDRYRS